MPSREYTPEKFNEGLDPRLALSWDIAAFENWQKTVNAVDESGIKARIAELLNKKNQ